MRTPLLGGFPWLLETCILNQPTFEALQRSVVFLLQERHGERSIGFPLQY